MLALLLKRDGQLEMLLQRHGRALQPLQLGAQPVQKLAARVDAPLQQLLPRLFSSSSSSSSSLFFCEQEWNEAGEARQGVELNLCESNVFLSVRCFVRYSGDERRCERMYT